MPRRRRHPRYKSKWEGVVAEQLKELGIELLYEVDTLKYIIPEKEHRYKPDWKIKNNRYIESKGIFDSKDRQKILFVKEQHPDVRIYMLFYNANQKLYKGSRTTYSDWCDKNGIEWSHRIIKREWIK